MFYKSSSDYVEKLKQIIFLKKLKNQQRLNDALLKTGNLSTTVLSLR
jgi:hypothetical protein